MTDGRNDGVAPDHSTPPPSAAEGAVAELQPEAAPAPPVARVGGARRRGIALWIAAAVVVVLAAAGSAPVWAPLLPWGGGGDALPAAGLQAEAEARRAVEARLARIESQLQQIQASGRNDTAAASALAAVSDRVGTLERRPDAGAGNTQDLAKLRQDLAALAARLDAVEARTSRLASDQAAAAGDDRMLFLAVAALRAAVAGSGPYESALGAVAALGSKDPAVTAAVPPLAASAKSGIPSTAVLAERFSAATAPAIFRAAAGADAGDSWVERILARIRALVVIRRVDGADADPTDAAVVRAQAALEGGDLAGAVEAVRLLKGAAAEAAAPWLALAERRVAVERTLDALSQQVAQHLAAEAR